VSIQESQQLVATMTSGSIISLCHTLLWFAAIRYASDQCVFGTVVLLLSGKWAQDDCDFSPAEIV